MGASPCCLHIPSSSDSLPEPLVGAVGRPRVLAIGGSDSSCGAGIQADLQAIVANGGQPLTAVTAVTAQHSEAVNASFPLDSALLAAQVVAAYTDAAPAAVKTGMLASRANVELLAEYFSDAAPSLLVVDPVLRASSGAVLLDDAGIEALRTRLLPLATLVTPNVPEAEALAGIEVRTLADVEVAGRRILAMGARAVLVKGGHLEAAPATDVLITTGGVRQFEGRYMPGREVHGTGCAYASAIATQLARGNALEDAVRLAKHYVEALIGTAVRVGPGALMADHLAAARVASEHAR